MGFGLEVLIVNPLFCTLGRSSQCQKMESGRFQMLVFIYSSS
ncbi:unnamed protein product [Arabidopsis halleri]